MHVQEMEALSIKQGGEGICPSEQLGGLQLLRNPEQQLCCLFKPYSSSQLYRERTPESVTAK